VTEIRGGDDASKQADMARLVGNKLSLKIIEINRHRNRLILSERQAVQERRDAMKERLIQEIHEGETRKGRVASIADFGAFVDIGGADGLVHLSELSWSRIKHPSEVLRVGDEVDVYVLGINANEKKIALSIKRTQREPWSQVAEKYQVGQLIHGTITQLANFGAFARIEDGVEGLIHVSELSDDRITHPRQLVREGDTLPLRIIRIDPQRRRIGLSLRRALDDDEARAEFEAFLERTAAEGRYVPPTDEETEDGAAAPAREAAPPAAEAVSAPAAVEATPDAEPVVAEAAVDEPAAEATANEPVAEATVDEPEAEAESEAADAEAAPPATETEQADDEAER
jgi:small subunit ribosomal protein S1